METDTQNFGSDYGLYKSCTPHEAFIACKQGAVIVDIREEYLSLYKQFDVEEVFYCPRSRFADLSEALPKDKVLIVADATGLYAKDAVLFLLSKGFKRVYTLAGGFIEWERDTMPIRTDLKERLTGSCACMLKPRNKKG